MKKVIFVLAALTILAAGCNKATTTETISDTTSTKMDSTTLVGDSNSTIVKIDTTVKP
jgi:uncharacterized lipoprotein YajG